MDVRLESMCHGDGKAYIQVVVGGITSDSVLALETHLPDDRIVPSRLHPFVSVGPSARANFVAIIPHLDVRELTLYFTELSASGEIRSASSISVEMGSVKWKSRFNTLLKNELTSQMMDVEREYSNDRMNVSFIDAIDDNEDVVVKVHIDMPYDPRSDINVKFLDIRGVEFDMPVYPLEDTVRPGVRYGEGKHLSLTFSVRVDSQIKEFCVVVYDEHQHIPGDFAVMSEDVYEVLNAHYRSSTLDASEDPAYDAWFRAHSATYADLALQEAASFPYQPLISIIVPLYRTPAESVRQMIQSVLSQTYPHWELVLVNASPEDLTLKAELLTVYDPRLNIVDVKENYGTAGNTNVGIARSTGDYVGFLDHEDILSPDCLFEFVRSINKAMREQSKALGVADAVPEAHIERPEVVLPTIEGDIIPPDVTAPLSPVISLQGTGTIPTVQAKRVSESLIEDDLDLEEPGIELDATGSFNPVKPMQDKTEVFGFSRVSSNLEEADDDVPQGVSPEDSQSSDETPDSQAEQDSQDAADDSTAAVESAIDFDSFDDEDDEEPEVPAVDVAHSDDPEQKVLPAGPIARSAADLLYCDQDHIHDDGYHDRPWFKPDFSPDFLTSMNYIGRFFLVSRPLIDAVAPSPIDFADAQDYDLVLKVTELTDSIIHLPKVLYHKRIDEVDNQDGIIPSETIAYMQRATRKLLSLHFDRLGIDADVQATEIPEVFRVNHHLPEKNPSVAIIIPNRDQPLLLKTCVRLIEQYSRYLNYEIIIVENGSRMRETFDTYRELRDNFNNVRVFTWNEKFNFSKVVNFAAAKVDAEYLLLLNNDTEAITPDFIETMVGTCLRDDVAVVGAKLSYCDDTVQHAGMVVGPTGAAVNIGANIPRDAPGYWNRLQCIQDLSAVSDACQLIKHSVFDEVGGYNENLTIEYNDVDFCLKVRRAGYRVVFNPYAELYHYEYATRGRDVLASRKVRAERERALLHYMWPEYFVLGDPFMSPNIHRESAYFQLS